MTPKFLSFLSFTWFTSTLICIILEGTYFATAATGIAGGSIPGSGTVINDLAAIQQLSVGGLIGIPAALITFARGLFRLLIWDYSFYTGGFEIIRWFFMATFSGAAVWGIMSVFAPVFANFLRIR